MLIPHALRAISEGSSANQFYRDLQASGAGVRRQVALRIFGQAKALAAEYGDEPTRPIDQNPVTPETRQWPTRQSSGVLQTVQLFYRERVTGNIIQRFYNVKTASGVTRSEAISQAIDANTGNAEKYQQELIGAVHTGVAILAPGMAA